MSDETPERVTVNKLRTLGDEERSDRPDRPEPASEETRSRARALLEAEFQHALMMKEKMGAEAAIGGKEKGREAGRANERVRGMIASLEGMSKFALKMGLLTAPEMRAMFSDAMEKGLYEGWGPSA